EMTPSAKGWDLFVESLSGALPALAPGSMIVLALIGYSYLILLKQKNEKIHKTDIRLCPVKHIHDGM
ncbi:MAG: hypothetical protein R3356_02740, partial [Eudoraea sp.]|nr:hypothetical protein [Eudoraea sp.]